MKRKVLAIFTLCALLTALTACAIKSPGDNAADNSGEESAESSSDYADFKTALMLPGIEGENAIFQMIANGIRDACKELGAPEPKVVEGGDQWTAYEKYLTSLAEAGIYEVIFTTTDVMRYCVNQAHKAYPEQKFVLIDADLNGYKDKFDGKEIPSTVWGVSFDLYQLGYLGGYFCGLVTQSDMERANDKLVVGLVFTDIYDPWEVDVKTGFTNGVKAAGANIEIINSVIGDWVDPQKGADVTRALFAQGADIVYYTTGASTYGCVTEAEAQGKYAIANDNNSISLSPDTVIACTLVEGYQAAHEAAIGAIQGTLEYGTGRTVGAAEGVISFTFDDPVTLEKVPAEILEKMQEAYQGLIDGSIDPRTPLE
ncbi:MAG: BMP family ABC transporter substrate-binding protein [Lachnospiraceae bacterium]|jgi:basic membrane lipoprotein Med (substrate-binding protein (PBP1-ABC) superfamily)|nr:BMP family ABC transporter substrate-binding protein [Lachnospiraceae bacterium]